MIVKTSPSLRFIFWGAVNTLLAYTVFIILYFTFSAFFIEQLAYMFGYIISFIFAVVSSYFLHCRYTFIVYPWSINQFISYMSMYVIIVIINLLLLPLLVEIFHISPIVSQGALYLVLPILTYFGQRKITFKL